MGIIGDVAGLFGGSDDQEQAKKILEQLQAEAGPSAFSKLPAEDPTLRSDQMSSLAALKSIADSGGMRTEDKVAQREAMDEADRRTQMQTGAALQSAAARGMSGGPAELAARLQAQQTAAESNAAAGSNAAAAASRRALQAIGQYGTQAGQVRGQDFGQNATVAQGTDAMSRFNSGQRVRQAEDLSGLYDTQGQRRSKQYQQLGNDAENTIQAVGSYGSGKGWW